MRKSKLYIIAFFLLNLGLFNACKHDKMVIIPASIQPYVDDFIQQAADRGIELSIEDLVILFEDDLEVDNISAAGLCQRGGGSPTIKLDTTSVNWTINLASREQLVFHELGHCVLNRPHINEKLPNENYRSIMRASGEQLYGLEYSKFKRNYYLDELFNEEASAPSWTDGVPRYNAVTNRQVIIDETFDNNNNNWSTGTNSNTRRTISGGKYNLTILREGGYFVRNQFNFDASQDYEIEAIVTLEQNAFGGVLWNGKPQVDTTFVGNDTMVENTTAFMNYYIGNNSITLGSFEFGAESSIELPQNSTSNKVTVRKIDNQLIFYFNEMIIDNMDANLQNFNEIGLPFGGGIGAKVQVERLKISYI